MKTLSGVAKVEKADLGHCLRREGSFLTAQFSMKFRLSFACRLSRPLLKLIRFDNVLKQGEFTKWFSFLFNSAMQLN